MFLFALMAYAQDPDPTAWTGKMVLLPSLVAPEGGLPSDDLMPLLRVQEGRFYNPQDVRLDIATLYRLGTFSRVEVDVESGAQPGPDGTNIEGVFVTYRVYPPPRLDSFRVEGNRHFSDGEIQRISNKEQGDTFFPEEAETIRESIRLAYQKAGWTEARVAVAYSEGEGRKVKVSFTVTEGEPQRLAEIRVDRREVLSRGRVSWELLRHQLRKGRPYQEASREALETALEQRLIQKGYYEAVVSAEISHEEAGDVLVVVVDPRRKYRVKSSVRALKKEAVATELRLSEGALPSRYFEEDASRQLTEALQGQGYLDAALQVQIERTETEVLIQVGGDSGPLYHLGKTVLVGDHEHNDRFLRGAIQEASPILDRGRVTRPAVESAILVLKEYYRSQGYLSARTSIQAFVPETRDYLLFSRSRVNLEIHAELGTQTVLHEVVIEGEDRSWDTLFDDLKNKPFNPVEVESRCRNIALGYQESGYLYADAIPEVNVSEDGKKAYVTIHIDHGPQVILRSILIQGNQHTVRRRIESEVTLQPGQPLSPSDISKLRRHLYDLEIFSRVEVEPIGDEDRVKDLLILVEERPRLYFELGGGAASDAGIQAFGRAGNRNLFGQGHRLTFLGQVGVGWVGTGWSLNIQEPEWRIAASYEAPDVPTPGEKLSVDVLFNAEDQERFFRIGRSGMSAGVFLSLGERSTLEIAYRVELRRLLDVEPSLILSNDPWSQVLSDASTSAGVASLLGDNLRPQSGLRFSLLVDRRDDSFNPRSGAALSAEVQISDGLGRLLVPATPEESAWVRAEAGLVVHVPISQLGLMLRLRGGAGFVGEDSTLPLEDRFRLGGGSSMRGFDIDSIGPAEEASGTEVTLPPMLEPLVDYAGRNDTRWIATGGDSMALASFELKIPLDAVGLSSWSDWQAAIFSDVGNVWFLNDAVLTESMSAYDDPFLRYSVGFGVRRTTVVGPIQLDVGFNPSPLSYRGEEPPFSWFPVPVRLHLSLGAL